MAQRTNWNEDFYAFLQIDKQASEDDIKKAYKQLAKVFHPDKNGNSLESTQKFQKLGLAYATLKDESTRADYDEYHTRWTAAYKSQPFQSTSQSGQSATKHPDHDKSQQAHDYHRRQKAEEEARRQEAEKTERLRAEADKARLAEEARQKREAQERLWAPGTCRHHRLWTPIGDVTPGNCYECPESNINGWKCHLCSFRACSGCARDCIKFKMKQRSEQTAAQEEARYRR